MAETNDLDLKNAIRRFNLLEYINKIEVYLKNLPAEGNLTANLFIKEQTDNEERLNFLLENNEEVKEIALLQQYKRDILGANEIIQQLLKNSSLDVNYDWESYLMGLKKEIRRGRNEAIKTIYLRRDYRTKIAKVESNPTVKSGIYSEGVTRLERKIREGISVRNISGYLAEICFKIWLNDNRSNSNYAKYLEQYKEMPKQNMGDLREDILKKEQVASLLKLIDELGNPCETILKMKVEGYSGKETVDALLDAKLVSNEHIHINNERRKCMNKLLNLIKQKGLDDLFEL